MTKILITKKVSYLSTESYSLNYVLPMTKPNDKILKITLKISKVFLKIHIDNMVTKNLF